MPVVRKKRISTKAVPAAAPVELALATSPATVAVTLPEGIWRWLAWAFSLIPVVGLTLGLLFAPSSDKKAKHFGRVCLVLALLGLIAMAVHGWIQQAGLDVNNSQDDVQTLD
jgi:hypothetical protein